MGLSPSSFARHAARAAGGSNGTIGGRSALGNALVGQLRRPTGVLGRLVALRMNRRNRGLNQGCIEALSPQKGSSVADLGFGGGASLRPLMDRVGLTGIVTGIDPSETMRARARKQYHDEIAMDRLRIVDGTAAEPGVEPGSQDGIMTVNTVFFWPDLEVGLAALQRRLKPGGALVVGVGPKKLQQGLAFDERAERAVEAKEIAQAMREVGFERVSTAAPRGEDGPSIARGYRPS